jgi:hypothetical protein
MAAAKPFPWWPATAVAAVALVAATALLRLPTLPPRSPDPARLPTVSVTRDPAGHSGLLAEQRAAFDPATLFLPAPLSRGATVLPDKLRPEVAVPTAVVPDQTLFFSQDRLAKSDAGARLTVQFGEFVPPPTTATELTVRPDAPLTLGRTEGNIKILPPRAGWVEAVAARSGQVIWAGELAAAPTAGAIDWQPLELLGMVVPAGLVGNLVVTQSSGSEDVDKNVRQQLTQVLRVGARLPPGQYTFRVGP